MSGAITQSLKALDIALSLLFQPICIACQRLSESALCTLCQPKNAIRDPLYLPLGSNKIVMARSLLWLDGASQKVIHKIKYEHRYDLLRLFHSHFETHFQEFFPSHACIVPVPLHPSRLLERHFNQSKVLAEWVAQKLRKKPAHFLIKRKATPPQSTLKKETRKKNLKGAFQWNGRFEPPECALLVDDIYTTGETLKACATALDKAGVRNIYAWTLFRTPTDIRICSSRTPEP